MKRSKWKGPFISKIKKKKLLVMPRNMEITSNLAGQTINVSNGKHFTALNIIEEMIGHKLGEFVATRAKFEFKKKKKQK